VLKKTGALPEKRRAPAEMGKWKDKIFRILMAEDNLINIRLTKLVLEKTGHKVDVAENGIEAINKLKANEYDLVLMDIEMPVMDGIEATRRIRAGEAGKEKKDITIIALTAHAINEIKSQAMNTGMDGYITKPIEITRLSQTIIEIQDGKSR
jgi:CheY-like chemotaxis protein